MERIDAIDGRIVHSHDEIAGAQIGLGGRPLRIPRHHFRRTHRRQVERAHQLLVERPSALTTPVDTVDSKPSGLPTATTS